MSEFLESPVATMIVLAAILAVLVAAGAYIIGRVRGEMRKREPTASEWLTKFQELHERGELNEEEYRTIKAMLAERFQRELKSNDERP